MARKRGNPNNKVQPRAPRTVGGHEERFRASDATTCYATSPSKAVRSGGTDVESLRALLVSLPDPPIRREM